MILRRATPEDAEAFAETADVCFATYAEFAPGWRNPVAGDRVERLAERLASPDVWALIAVDGDDVAGHVSVAERALPPAPPDPRGHARLWQLFDKPPWQGGPLATRLLHAAEREASGRGFAGMTLWTPRDHMRARRFYEREGWAATGAEDPTSPMGLPLVEYARNLP